MPLEVRHRVTKHAPLSRHTAFSHFSNLDLYGAGGQVKAPSFAIFHSFLSSYATRQIGGGKAKEIDLQNLTRERQHSIKDKFHEVGARLRRKDLSRDSSTASITVLPALDVQDINKQARQD